MTRIHGRHESQSGFRKEQVMKRRAFVWPVVGLCALAGGVFLTSACRGREQGQAEGAAQTVRYHCVMHPHYVSDKPGDCPICGMKLVPLEAPPKPSGERRILYYRSPMDPAVRSDRPAKDAMGMDFIAVYEDELHGAAASIPGRASVTLSAEKRQVLGVRSEPVRRDRLTRVIRTVCSVAVDERRLHHIHTKYD